MITVKHGKHALFDTMLPGRFCQIRLREPVVINVQVAQIEFVVTKMQIRAQKFALIPNGTLGHALIAEWILQHHLRLRRR